MPRSSLTGTRIRERRILQGIRQSHLAERVGISPSYLNLIEHNRRRIGGKLLNDIAAVLNVEPSLLAEGAESVLIALLREAVAEAGEQGVEIEQAESFAGHYPGWARLVVAQRRQIAALGRAVETLTDRLTHDPHLAATLHEVLDTISAVRSTASILAETREIEPEWRDRFHRNINEDATRLAEGAQALVTYLDGASDARRNVQSPQEEIEAFFVAHDFHFPALEDESLTPEEIMHDASELVSGSAVSQALKLLRQYAVDAKAVPLAELRAVVDELGPDPFRIAVHLGMDQGVIMRRLAALPELEAGLVACDGSGTLVFRKPLPGFPLPRFSAACPLWPLYRALTRPMAPLHMRMEQQGRGTVPMGGSLFDAFAVALPKGPATVNTDPIFEAQMLFLPVPGEEREVWRGGVVQVGANCRICPRMECHARREPSIIADGF